MGRRVDRRWCARGRANSRSCARSSRNGRSTGCLSRVPRTSGLLPRFNLADFADGGERHRSVAETATSRRGGPGHTQPPRQALSVRRTPGDRDVGESHRGGPVPQPGVRRGDQRPWGCWGVPCIFRSSVGLRRRQSPSRSAPCLGQRGQAPTLVRVSAGDNSQAGRFRRRCRSRRIAAGPDNNDLQRGASGVLKIPGSKQ